MNTPTPVDVSRLKGILGNAKKIMNKVESNNFTTGNIDARALSEDGIKELQSEGIKRPAVSTEVTDYTEEQVRNSNLPPAIKEAMIKNKIPKVSMASTTFSLDDVSDLVEKPMGFVKTPITKKTLNERVENNSDLITISESKLNDMIQAKLMEFLITHYNKTLTEDTIAKTINTLIKEGKILTKKKTL